MIYLTSKNSINRLSSIFTSDINFMKTRFTLATLLLVNLLSWSQTDTPPNIIFLIGDGMGLTQITSGMYSNNNTTALEAFEYIGLSKTHAYKNLVTDSAASGTAMACGEKTYNGVVGINPKNESMPSILNHCSDLGYRTALLASSSIVHATPASFYAHADSRKKYQEIATQLMSSKVDLFIGGGEMHFTRRDDDKNLLKSDDNPYEIVNNLENFSKSTAQKIGYFTYSDEPPSKKAGRKPSLPDMLATTLKKLDTFDQPFFVMTEGSQIDWGGHANDLQYIVSEFLEFNETIAVALDYAKKHGNTLVVVTADHETGGLALTKGNVKKAQVGGGFNTKGHSATMVPVFSYGTNAEAFKGIYENTAIFDKMKMTVQKK